MENRIIETIKKKELTLEHLSEILNTPIEELDIILEKLMKERKIFLNSKNRYCLLRPEYVIDTLKSKTKGIKYINDGRENIVIQKDDLHTALKYDTVVVDRTYKNYGKVIGILKRQNKKLVCEVKEKDNKLYLVPFNENCELSISCNKNLLKDFIIGDRVYVELDDHHLDDDNTVIANKITKIGHFNDKFNDEIAIAITKDFDIDFSEEALEEVKNIPTEVTENDIKNRLDLRSDIIFTIDSIHTKDMDDAISIKKLYNGNYLLGVHIADVAHYIKPGSALFKDALKRGTSVYLGDVVIPMIPSELSNGICSLNEGVDRLTKTCYIELNPKGKIVNHKIVDSVINSKKKMTYEELNEIFKNKTIEDPTYLPFLPTLELARELSNILTNKKNKRGNLDFESSDINIKKENDKPVEFEVRNNEEAQKIIENFMIIANEVVASHFYWRDLPFIYRIHNNPDEIKLENTIDLIENLGYKLVRIQNAYGQKALQNILNDFKDTKEFSIISNLILRNMSKAKYSPHNDGHFALALDNYCHFTSPIRRFPDLMVHILINKYVHNKTGIKYVDKLETELQEICEHSSYKERQANDAEKDYIKLKMAEYMAEHINEEFEGILLDIDKDQVFIKLDNNIKGILDENNIMNSAFEIDQQNRELKCKYSKQKIKLGTNLILKVTKVDIPQKEIYFEIKDIIKKQNNSNKKLELTKKNL